MKRSASGDNERFLDRDEPDRARRGRHLERQNLEQHPLGRFAQRLSAPAITTIGSDVIVMTVRISRHEQPGNRKG